MIIEEFIQQIKEDRLLDLEVRDLKGNRLRFKVLSKNKDFTAVGLKLKEEKSFEDAEKIFKAMLDMGETSSATQNNYGAVILDDVFSKLRKKEPVDPDRMGEARKSIFKACDFDKKVGLAWPAAPAYKNLCFLRNIEAYYRYSNKDFIGAFLLGWISIEMTLHRIWFQYLQKTCSGILNQQSLYNKLMTLPFQAMFEILFATKIFDKKIVKNLENLREIRNKLVHGEINDPDMKNVEDCIGIGHALIPLLQQD